MGKKYETTHTYTKALRPSVESRALSRLGIGDNPIIDDNTGLELSKEDIKKNAFNISKSYPFLFDIAYNLFSENNIKVTKKLLKRESETHSHLDLSYDNVISLALPGHEELKNYLWPKFKKALQKDLHKVVYVSYDPEEKSKIYWHGYPVTLESYLKIQKAKNEGGKIRFRVAHNVFESIREHKGFVKIPNYLNSVFWLSYDFLKLDFLHMIMLGTSNLEQYREEEVFGKIALANPGITVSDIYNINKTCLSTVLDVSPTNLLSAIMYMLLHQPGSNGQRGKTNLDEIAKNCYPKMYNNLTGKVRSYEKVFNLVQISACLLKTIVEVNPNGFSTVPADHRLIERLTNECIIPYEKVDHKPSLDMDDRYNKILKELKNKKQRVKNISEKFLSYLDPEKDKKIMSSKPGSKRIQRPKSPQQKELFT